MVDDPSGEREPPIGLIPVGAVDHPYWGIGVGDFLLGTLVSGIIALLGLYTLKSAFRRKSSPLGESSDSSGNA